MKQYFLNMPALLIVLSGLAACEKAGDRDMVDIGVSEKRLSFQPQRRLPPERWYSEAQAARGNSLYQVNCAVCHKQDASGTGNWKQRDAEGKLPPPPLNGTAHAWHHPLSVLRRTVRLGGVPLGGTMPGFADKLSAEEIDAILAWIQSHWSDEVYRVWQERNNQAGRT